LFWFDIVGQKLMMRSQQAFRQWLFPEMVSAAGWVDEDTLLVAGETAFWRFTLSTGERQLVASLEADNAVTRSNDGRADPWGGFWIGTMGKQAQPGAGAIYRYYRGEITKLFDGLTITNAIAFSPDKGFATFADTATNTVMRVALSAGNGSPLGEPEVFLDLSREGRNPDGALFDADGCFWLAEWGSSRVACYGPDGSLRAAVDLPTPHVTCPAFGGPDLKTLYITTAREGLGCDDAGYEASGQTFALPVEVAGIEPSQVLL
jgi:sugar lactone lactonase YvrE